MSRQGRIEDLPEEKKSNFFPIVAGIGAIVLISLFGFLHWRSTAGSQPNPPGATDSSVSELKTSYKDYIDCLDTTLSTRLVALNGSESDESFSIRAFVDYKRNTADIFYQSIVKESDYDIVKNEIEKSKSDLLRRAMKDSITLSNCNQ